MDLKRTNLKKLGQHQIESHTSKIQNEINWRKCGVPYIQISAPLLNSDFHKYLQCTSHR